MRCLPDNLASWASQEVDKKSGWKYEALFTQFELVSFKRFRKISRKMILIFFLSTKHNKLILYSISCLKAVSGDKNHYNLTLQKIFLILILEMIKGSFHYLLSTITLLLLIKYTLITSFWFFPFIIFSWWMLNLEAWFSDR